MLWLSSSNPANFCSLLEILISTLPEVIMNSKVQENKNDMMFSIPPEKFRERISERAAIIKNCAEPVIIKIKIAGFAK